MSTLSETLIYAVYYAPRGRARLYALGRDISERHLYPTDLLVGIIGAEGSGKSTLLRGMFPGLELTNDDDGINFRSAPLFDFNAKLALGPHTYHVDARYEQAFHQLWELAEAVRSAVRLGRRVIVEHFDLLHDHLGFDANVLIGVGEEVVVARPNVFGPKPDAIRDIAYRTLKYRKMAHTAEDLTSLVLSKQYGYQIPLQHSDVKHGFVIGFPADPGIDLSRLQAEVLRRINDDLQVTPAGENHIRIGEDAMVCTGVRTHVKSTGQILAFRLLPQLKVNPITGTHLLVGVVGDTQEEAGFDRVLKTVG